MPDPAVTQIAAGYDAVYAALPHSPTFARIWREQSLGSDYPAGFEHISFLTLAEMQSMATALALAPGTTLADLGCGMGGPGLWIARETQAQLAGIDISSVALDRARARSLSPLRRASRTKPRPEPKLVIRRSSSGGASSPFALPRPSLVEEPEGRRQRRRPSMGRKRYG